jgi:hypothetical protein
LSDGDGDGGDGDGSDGDGSDGDGGDGDGGDGDGGDGDGGDGDGGDGDGGDGGGSDGDGGDGDGSDGDGSDGDGSDGDGSDGGDADTTIQSQHTESTYHTNYVDAFARHEKNFPVEVPSNVSIKGPNIQDYKKLFDRIKDNINSLEQTINFVKLHDKNIERYPDIQKFIKNLFNNFNTFKTEIVNFSRNIEKNTRLQEDSIYALKRYNIYIVHTANILLKLYQLEREGKVKLRTKFCNIPKESRPSPDTTIANSGGTTCWINAAIQLMYRIPQFRAVVMTLDKINVDAKLRPRPVLTKLAEIFKRLDTGPNIEREEIKTIKEFVNEVRETHKKFVERNKVYVVPEDPKDTSGNIAFEKIDFELDPNKKGNPIDLYSAILNILAPWEYDDFPKDDDIHEDFFNDFRYTIQLKHKTTKFYHKAIPLKLTDPIQSDEYICEDYVLVKEIDTYKFYNSTESSTLDIDIKILRIGTFNNEKYSLIGLMHYKNGDHYIYYRFNDKTKSWCSYDDFTFTNLGNIFKAKESTRQVRPTLLLYRKDDIDNIYKDARVEYFALPSDNLDPLEQNDETQEYLDPITSK